MKNLKMLYIALIALVAGVFTACTTDFEPGPQKTGPQVSFEATNPKSLEFTGDAAENAKTLTLKRVEKKDELEVLLFTEVVTVEAEGNVPVTDPETFFTIPESVTFAAGEDTAVLAYTVNQEAFANDKTYAVNFVIANETVATPYGYAEWKVKYALNPWELVKDSKGNNAKGKVRIGDFFTGYFNVDPSVEIDANIYEHKSIKGRYKVEDPWGATAAASFGYASIEEAVEDGLGYTPTDLIIDCTDPNKCYIPQQPIGIDVGYGAMAIWSDYDPEQYPNGIAGVLEEGVLTWEAKGIYIAMANYNEGKFVAGNANGLFRVVLPGVEIADYSLAVAYDGMDVAADNKTTTAKFKFTYGADVTDIKYLIVNGNVESNPTEALTTLFAGEDENIKSVENFVQGDKEVGIKIGMESGVYTMVAAPADKNGALRTKEAIVYSFYFKGIGEAEEHPCEVEAKLEKYSTLYDDNAQTDYSALAMYIKGSELKEVTLAMFATSTVKTYMDEGGLTMSQLFELASVAPISAQGVTLINSAEGVTDYYTGLNSDTSYTLLVSATNNYGESKELRIEAKTDPVPYSGSLVVGKYYMTCTMGAGTENETKFENVFTVEPVPGSNTNFLLSTFAIEDNMKWKAVYDETANTLTLSGEANGLEDYGPLFGNAYGTYEAAQSLYYGIFSYASEASKTGKDPIVLNVDATTKQICGLPTEASIYVYVIQETSTGGQILGAYSAFDDTTTIAPYTEQPAGGENGGGENGGASTNSIMSVRAPFSSVTIDKSIVAAKSKFQSIKAAGVISNTKISGVRTVKLSVVEQYTPAKVKGFTKVKADAAAIRR